MSVWKGGYGRNKVIGKLPDFSNIVSKSDLKQLAEADEQETVREENNNRGVEKQMASVLGGGQVYARVVRHESHDCFECFSHNFKLKIGS